MALEFKKVAKPVIKRVENDFIEPVGQLEPGSEEALTFELPNKSEDDKKQVRVTLRLLTEAGNENNVTVRRSVVETKETATITFWTVPKIKHGESVDEIKESIESAVKHEVEEALSKG